jgi:hypothetical protein
MASLQDNRRILVIPYRVVMHAINVAALTASEAREATRIIESGVIREESEAALGFGPGLEQD